MAYASARKGRVAVKEQGSGWGTAETSFVAGDVVECEVVLPPLTKEALQTQTFKTGVHEDTIVAGSKAGVEVSLSSSQPFTVAVWIKTPSALGSLGIVSTGYGASNHRLQIASSKFQATWPSGGTAESAALSTSTWYHVALAGDAAECSLMVDGVEVDTQASGIESQTFDAFTVGQIRDSDTNAWPLDGHVFEVAVWLRRLSERECAALYSGGTWTDPRLVSLPETPDYLWHLGNAAGTPLTCANLGSAAALDLVATSTIAAGDLATETP